MMRVRFPSAALQCVASRRIGGAFRSASVRSINRADASSPLLDPSSRAAGAAGTGIGLPGCRSNSETADGAAYVNWPTFGRVPERTHYLPARGPELDPPLRQAWSVNTHALIEFPPALAGGVAYLVNKYGNGAAIRLGDRKVLWRLKTHPSDKGKPTDVTAPVYHGGRVYLAFIDGQLVARDAATGRVEWERDLGGHHESSPLAVNGTIYLGTDTTNLVALDAGDGSMLWQFNSPGAIKASPSHHDGRVFVADYEGGMFALDAASGRVAWRTDTAGTPRGGSGGFFSSPAIGFGHVYAARDDGVVFAFDERTGKVAWTFSTGGTVYGSPALAQVPGTPASVYIGAENGRFFAIDVATGKPRWHYEVGGPVPGTATVIGHTVYTSSFTARRTIGLDVRDGKQVFAIDQAGYTPVVSDGKRLFLVSYFELIGLEPRRR